MKKLIEGEVVSERMNKENLQELDKSFDKEYIKVNEHRRTCKKWSKKFCIRCFGNGLNIFYRNVRRNIEK